MILVFFFFFQAEDGIRDGTVTGVQTCALPISTMRATMGALSDGVRSNATQSNSANSARSEERRVGKECRSRGAPDHEKKKIVTSRLEILQANVDDFVAAVQVHQRYN